MVTPSTPPAVPTPEEHATARDLVSFMMSTYPEATEAHVAKVLAESRVKGEAAGLERAARVAETEGVETDKEVPLASLLSDTERAIIQGTVTGLRSSLARRIRALKEKP